MEREPTRLFEFGQFCLDTRERSLSRGGKPVPLTPKSFEILLALVENRGHTLTKDELIDRVWPDSFVEIGNLNRNISTLRSVLGDDSHRPRFIKTLPKRGYRFDADVREVIEDEEELEIERRTKYRVSLSKTQTQNSVSSGRFSIKGLGLIGGAVSAVVITGIFSLGFFQNSGSVNAGADHSISRTRSMELYSEARGLWNDRTGESLHEATLLLEQTVASDPGFALAHSALADAYAFDSQNRPKAIETARRAIEIDPTLGEPHASIGFVKMFWEWEFAEADLHFRQAIDLSPNYSTGHQWYSLSLMATGQGNAALAEIRKAVELEPDSPAINADFCQILYFNRRLDEAEAQCLRTLEIAPKFLNAHLLLYEIYSAKGKYDKAVEQFFKNEELVDHYSAFPGMMNELRREYETGGIRAYWKKRIEMLAKLPSRDYQMALYHARLGDKEQVIQLLNKAHENRDLSFMTVLAEPLFQICCHADPRFAILQEHLIQAKDKRSSH